MVNTGEKLILLIFGSWQIESIIQASLNISVKAGAFLGIIFNKLTMQIKQTHWNIILRSWNQRTGSLAVSERAASSCRVGMWIIRVG